jgi:hypothetical protein
MSLLGLLRHLADVERAWFRSFMAGHDAPSRFCSRDDPDGDFDGARPDEAFRATARRFAMRQRSASARQHRLVWHFRH